MFFRHPHDTPKHSPGDLPDTTAVAEKAPQSEYAILCRQCLQIITNPAERIEAQGAHQHTFANPGGIVYQIGCFNTAKGCAQAGPSTNEFTWFHGFRWQVAVCRACLSHLGWWFASDRLGSFYGLIIDRLIFPD